MNTKDVATTNIKNLITTINLRKGVANRKIDIHYREKYNNGCVFVYAELLSDLYGILNKLED